MATPTVTPQDLPNELNQIRQAEAAARQPERERDDNSNSPPTVEEMLAEAQEALQLQDFELFCAGKMARTVGTVLKVSGELDMGSFEEEDKVVILQRGPYLGRLGVVKVVNAERGIVRVKISCVDEHVPFRVGIGDDPQECKLLYKDDGTNMLVGNSSGEISVHWNNPSLKLRAGDSVSLLNYMVVGKIDKVDSGNVYTVVQIIDEQSIEVDRRGEKVVVRHVIEDIKEGDNVVVDASGHFVVRHIKSEKTRYSVSETKVTWNHVGGVDRAKHELRQAIEWPTKHPELFKQYNQQPPKGILLYGPPGCGKTLLGKAAATAVAEIHGMDNVPSGFQYVKAPEVLSQWVGESEAQTRALFSHSRNHFEEHGYPCVTFVDEADAILCERGSDHHNKWRDTLVGQWLAEMDGIGDHQGIWLFATNRPDSLDGAITREGRIDLHIKVPRPDQMAAMSILKIHLSNVPTNESVDEMAALTVAQLWSSEYTLYTAITKDGSDIMRLCDCASGAMIAGLAQRAKRQALARDVAAGDGCKGVTKDDLLQAVGATYQSHYSLSHTFDMFDFCERKGWDPKSVKFEKLSATILNTFPEG